MNKESKQVLAVFDFDKTITNKHTFIRFLQYMRGRRKFIYTLLLLIPTMIKYKLGHLSLMQLRERAIERLYKDIPETDYKDYCQDFVDKHIKYWLSKDAIEKIRWHKAENHTLVLLSNSPEEYLNLWGIQFGFDYVFGTKFEFQEGRSTGKIVGDHCFGEKKVERLKEVFGKLENYYIYGYGDSDADIPFLTISDEPYFKHFDLNNKYIPN